MNLIQKIGNITSFNFNQSGKLVTKTTNNSIYCEDLKFNFKGKPYAILGDKCICDIRPDCVNIYDLNFKELISIEKKGVIAAGIFFFKKKYYSIRWEDKNEKNYFSIYDDEKEIYKYLDFYGFILNETKRLLYEGFNFSKFRICSLRDNTPDWSYSLPKGFNIDNKPKLINNILFFRAYNENQKNQLLTGLDIETGKEIWQNEYEVTSEHNFIQATAFNKKNQLYYGFYSNYQVFNPKTGVLIVKKEIAEIEKNNLEPYVNAIYDDKLWFVSGRGLQTKFGYINVKTQQIELLQDFPQEEDEFFDTPVFHEGKLYLRGKHFNTLYIFE